MIYRTVLRLAVAAMLPLAFTACASLAPEAGKATSRSQIDAAQRLFHETIDLTGRLSVRYQSNQKEEALHGSFTWAQTPARTTVTLLSPLGQTIAIIDATPQRATLTQGGHPPRIAATVDALTADALGWPLPVAGLRSWLQGFATDHAGIDFVATPTAEDVTTPEGWRIRYANWQSDTNSLLPIRPKRIDLSRLTAQAGNVSIRIVIDTWQTP